LRESRRAKNTKRGNKSKIKRAYPCSRSFKLYEGGGGGSGSGGRVNVDTLAARFHILLSARNACRDCCFGFALSVDRKAQDSTQRYPSFRKTLP